MRDGYASRSQLRWVVVASTWLLLVPTGLLVVRLLLPSDGLPVMEASGAISEVGLRVSPPHPVSGVVDGDVVVSVDGQAIGEMLADPATHRVVKGDRHTLVIRRGTQQHRTVVAVGSHRDFGSLLAQGWPLLLSTFLVLLLAVWFVVRRPFEQVAHALLLFSAALFSLPLAVLAYWEPLDLSARPWVAAWSMLGLAGFMESAVAVLMFALAFPGGRPAPAAARVVRWLMAVPILVVTITAAMYIAGQLSVSRSMLVDGIVGVCWLVGVATALTVLGRNVWTLRRDPVARRRSQVVLLGLTVSLVPWMVLNLVSNDVGPLWFVPLFIAFPASIVVAVARRDLFELDLILNRSLVATITAVVLLAVYAGVVAAVSSVVAGSGPLLAVPAAGAVAVLFAPVREHAQRGVSQRLFGLAADPGVVFERLGKRLSNASDSDALMAAVVETVTESLRLPYAAVELDLAGSPRIIEQRGHPTGTVESVELRVDDRVVGRVLVSPRRDDTSLGPHDTTLLANLARHAAVAARVSVLTNTLRETQRQLVVSREAERDRIQHDLHDRIGPVLVGLALQLSAVADQPDPKAAHELLGRLEREATNAVEDVRRLARDLRPAELEQIGLSAALEAAGARLGATKRFRFDFEIPLALPRLSEEREDTVYMVVLEAMTNSVRHSGGHRASIRLTAGAGQAVDGVVEDDGSGVSGDPCEGTGLESMRRRIASCGGQLAIGRSRLGGALISFHLPAMLQ